MIYLPGEGGGGGGHPKVKSKIETVARVEMMIQTVPVKSS